MISIQQALVFAAAIVCLCLVCFMLASVWTWKITQLTIKTRDWTLRDISAGYNNLYNALRNTAAEQSEKYREQLEKMAAHIMDTKVAIAIQAATPEPSAPTKPGKPGQTARDDDPDGPMPYDVNSVLSPRRDADDSQGDEGDTLKKPDPRIVDATEVGR